MNARREFMKAAGRLGLGGAGVLGIDLGLGARARRATGEAPRTIHLEAREVAWELAPGKTVKAMAYNGRIPGPEIRVREGERVRVHLKNSLTEPTTIHWHGVDVPNPMDGVPGVTQKPVAPGASFVYEFEARPAGTRWYHTHVDEHRQLDLGLAAPLIIDPVGASEPMAYDREVTLVLDDWVSGTGPAVPPMPEGVAGGSGMMGGRGMGGMMRGMGGMMGGGDTPPYDTMTINGKAYPATESLLLRRGERVRLRLVNASNEHSHVVRLAGHRLHVTHTDGNPLRVPVEVDAVPLAPSERCDAVVIAERPGAWFLQCLQPGHADAGERMRVTYQGHDGARPSAAQERPAGLDLWHPGLGRGGTLLPPATGATRLFDLTLSGGMMNRDVWTINRKVYPNTDPLAVKRGDRVRLRLGNMSPEAHPMHLHGQSFRVLALNGVRYAEPVVKDSVDVAAHMGSAVLEFTAHNPGEWFFHCHKPMHMMGGMITLVKIG